jgi:hypothetical protein
MSEWWTYTATDFLLFSPRVYYRLFELYNRSFWPVAIISIVFGLAIFELLRWPRPITHRLIPAILGVLWIWIAWAFFWQRYAGINWASVYLAPLFGLQGLALFWTGAAGRLKFVLSSKIPNVLVLAIYAFSLVGYPFVAALMGRPPLSAEIFGLAPDPTALATLALLALADDRSRWPLLMLPLIWCLVSGLTLWTMGAGDFFIAPAGALSAMATLYSGKSRQGRTTGG